MEKLKEECGVFGFCNNDNEYKTSQIIFAGVYALQHRGQESSGIAVYNGEKINYHKDLGLVGNVFTEEILESLEGNCGVGHVKYSHSPNLTVDNTQPIVSNYVNGSLAVTHNGSIVNFNELKKELINDGYIFHTTTTTEVISALIAKNSVDNTSVEDALVKVMKKMKGGYSLAVLSNNKLIGVRDPLGIRPLCIGKLKNSYIISSESAAIDCIGGEFIRDVLPGEIVVIDGKDMKSIQGVKEKKSALCAFEYIYFARPDSIIDGASVYSARFKSGILLSQECEIDADIVIGVPDSGISAAIGYAVGSGIPYVEGFMKNRYVGRTFIQPKQFLREKSVNLKLNPIVNNVKGRRVIMVDDSLVRGTTSKRIVSILKKAGAKEVHLVLACPPIKYACHYGIDTPQNLIASEHSVEEIKEVIGADSLHYLSEENMIKAIEGVQLNLCTACTSGKYPVEVEKKPK